MTLKFQPMVLRQPLDRMCEKIQFGKNAPIFR